MWPTMSASICSESSLEIAVFETLFKNANWRERRCSSANRRAFSIATETCPAAVFKTSKSRCSKTYSRFMLTAVITPVALPFTRIGAPQKDLAGRGGTSVTPKRSRARSRSERISSGCPVRRMYSVSPLSILRRRFGNTFPSSTSSS